MLIIIVNIICNYSGKYMVVKINGNVVKVLKVLGVLGVRFKLKFKLNN